MKTLLALAAVALFALPFQTQAATAATGRSDADCAELLERWSTDPKAAPRSEINACKDQLAAGAAPVPVPEPVAAVDPCSGPGAAGSVLCWGPWAALAPAADAPLVTLNIPEAGVECDSVAELSDQCVPQLQLQIDPPVEACQPGTPCGFTTIVSGVTSNGEAEDTGFGRIDLANDGTSFVINSEGGDDIVSVPMTTNIQPRPDGTSNLRSSGREGDVNSRLVARIVQDEDEEIVLAADIWTHGTRENARSGYFAWSTATSQGGLDALIAGNVSLNFSGPMAVNKATTGNMTLNFGANPSWTGTWTNPAWSFGAGGVVTGPNLISMPSQFTDNVTGSGSFVQGAIVGEEGGPRGVLNIIDVTLAGQGRIKDVGLLRDLVAGPPIEP